MPGGSLPIRWWRVLLGGFLIELALMVVAAVLFLALPDPQAALNIAVPPATLLVAMPIAAWVARRTERPVLAGTLTGAAALLIYGLTMLLGVLASPERANFVQALGPAYLASHVLKLTGGALGGWWASRRG